MKGGAGRDTGRTVYERRADPWAERAAPVLLVRQSMSRTPTILAVLAALALVLVGAWWIGATPEDAVETRFEVLDEGVEPAGDPQADLAGADLADAVELAPGERVALPEAESGTASPAATGAATPRPDRTGARIVRGTLVDASTNEPLPHYRFELQDRGREQNLVETDEHGAFESTEELLPGELSARYLEAGNELVPAGELRVGDDGAVLPLALRVASGPTFRIELAPADAPPLAENSLWIALDEGRGRSRGVVIGSNLDRVRFGPLPSAPNAGAPAKIVVESKDGVWRGARGVRYVPGIQPGTLEIALEALAALEVRVVGPDGAALENASVWWTPAESGKPREVTTRKDGRAVYERILAEPGTLKVRLVRWRELEIPLLLAQGVRHVETATLTRAPSSGAIRGTIVSDSGLYERDVRMRLVPLDLGRGVGALDARVRWSTKSGARVGLFDFDDLPAGRFRLEVSENDFFVWEPRRVELEAPREDVLVVVKDTVAVTDLLFEPRDEDGTPFPGSFEVRLAALGETRTFPGRDGRLLLTEFPVDAPLRWRIDADGRAGSFGSWNELSPLASVAGRERRGATPVLARGWAQLYRVVRANDRKPIEGALAVVDGREGGRTDAQGRIVVRADARPGKVAFRWKDWRVIDRVDAAPTRRGANEFERTVRMEAPKKAPKKKP